MFDWLIKRATKQIIQELSEDEEPKRQRRLKDEVNEAKLKEFIAQYGLEGTRKLIEKGKTSSGILFDITITKEDLKDTELINAIQMLIQAQSGQAQAQLPKGAKNIVDAAQLVNLLGQLGITQRRPEYPT